MHALSNYNGSNILIATPESDLSADQQALNNNFKNIVTGFVPYSGATGNVNLGSHGALANFLTIQSPDGSTVAGKIFTVASAGTPPYVLMVNAGAANSDMIVQPPQSLADGLAFSSVDDANSTNLSFELRGSTVFLNSVGGNDIIFASGINVGQPLNPPPYYAFGYHTNASADTATYTICFGMEGTANFQGQMNFASPTVNPWGNNLALPTGTTASPPGVNVGDLWIDTTDAITVDGKTHAPVYIRTA